MNYNRTELNERNRNIKREGRRTTSQQGERKTTNKGKVQSENEDKAFSTAIKDREIRKKKTKRRKHKLQKIKDSQEKHYPDYRKRNEIGWKIRNRETEKKKMGYLGYFPDAEGVIPVFVGFFQHTQTNAHGVYCHFFFFRFHRNVEATQNILGIINGFKINE